MQKRIILYCLLFVLLAGTPVAAAFSAIIEPGVNTLGVNFSHITLDNDDYRPVYGARLHLISEHRRALGADYYLRPEKMQLVNVFLQYQLENPILEDTWAAGFAGYSDLRNFARQEIHRGVVVGVLFTREFRENWQAHTGISFYIYRGLLDLGFETGFQYFIGDNLSAELTYKGYPLGVRGLNLGANIHF